MKMARHMGKRSLVSPTKYLVGGAASLVVLGAAGGAALASSGGGTPLAVQTADANHSAMPGMPSMPAAAMHGPSVDYHTSVTLRSMPTGTVALRQVGDTLQATISAVGLTPGSAHVAALTSGANDAPVVFSSFTASATGQVAATVSAMAPLGGLGKNATFQIELSTSPGQPIAVARLRGEGIDHPLPLRAVEPNGVGQLDGRATLTYDRRAQTLTVDVHARGFVPNTTHAAHVHQGSCALQGAPIVMLPDLHADGQGEINQRDVLRNLTSFVAPAGGWYLNIHEGSSATILDAAGQPTVQFRPLLCSNLPVSTGSAHQQAPAGSSSMPSSTSGAPGSATTSAAPTTPAPANGAPTGGTPATGAEGNGAQANGGQGNGGQGNGMGGTNGAMPAPTTTAPAITSSTGQSATGSTSAGNQGTASPPAPTAPTAPVTAPPTTPTTAAPATSGQQQTILSAQMTPVGSNLNRGAAEVYLRPATGRICVNLELFKVPGSLPGTITDAEGNVQASFSFLGVSDGGFRSACTSVSAANISEIAANPGNFRFDATAPATALAPAQPLVGILHSQGGGS